MLHFSLHFLLPACCWIPVVSYLLLSTFSSPKPPPLSSSPLPHTTHHPHTYHHHPHPSHIPLTTFTLPHTTHHPHPSHVPPTTLTHPMYRSSPLRTLFTIHASHTIYAILHSPRLQQLHAEFTKDGSMREN